MIILLYESDDNIITTVVPKLKRRYNETSVGYITSRNYKTLEKDFMCSPLLDNNWIIFAEPKFSKVYFDTLSKLSKDNLIVLKTSSREVCKEINLALSDMREPYKFVDNINIDKKDVIKYIQDELKVSASIAQFLYNWQGGYLKNIIASIEILRTVDKITEKTIQRYIPQNNSGKIYDILSYLLGTSDVSYFIALNIVNKYKYGLDYLVNYLEKSLALYLEIQQLKLDGILNITNYRVIKMSNEYKCLDDISQYRLKHIIEDLDSISYDYLLFLYEQVKLLQEDNHINIMKLINLLQIRKRGK